MDHELAKVVIGTVGTVLGALIAVLGRKRARAAARYQEEQTEPVHYRQIERKEWHDLRELLHKAMYQIDELKRDLGRIEGRTERDHDKLSALKAELEYLKAQLEAMSDHCNHCPPGAR
jgi:chromosome segregation ATPase